MRILSADHVLPVSSEPIRGGAVALEGTRIAAVGSRKDLVERFPECELTEFGGAVILPGFVNCHSHLEITAMRGALDAVEHDFRRWLIRLNDLRKQMSDEDIRIAAIAGVTEGARAGVTCFGDIGRIGEAGFEALKAVGLRGVSFQETEFSPDDRTADNDLAVLLEKFSSLRERQTALVEAGISPHSPYTVSRRLFEKIARFALDEKVKLTIHAAESPEEDLLMRRGEGFFTGVYEKLGCSWESPGCSSIEFLRQTGVLEARPLLAHCVTVSDEDIAAIRDSGSAVAHCPKSNAKFGHGTAPLEKLIDAGIEVGLGSDSVASNNLCDIIEESRFAALAQRSRPGRERLLSPREIIRAATFGGAAALGLGEIAGTLEPGKQADIAVVSLSSIAQQPVSDVEAAIVFSSGASDVAATFVAGSEVFSGGQTRTVDESYLKTRLAEIGRVIEDAV